MEKKKSRGVVITVKNSKIGHAGKPGELCQFRGCASSTTVEGSRFRGTTSRFTETSAMLMLTIASVVRQKRAGRNSALFFPWFT